LTLLRFFAYHAENGNTAVHQNERLESHSAQQTIDLGTELGRRLHRGDVVALHGPLGAGKTTLVKGIALSLHIQEPVTSPSFTLIAEYEGYLEGLPVVLYHVDLYRIGHPQEIEDLGLEEILNGSGICVIEWAEKASDFLPESAIQVKVGLLEGQNRLLEIEGALES
jgi:tRNA threonylcarbamoyladenosine biosynthesis protein TsaE